MLEIVFRSRDLVKSLTMAAIIAQMTRANRERKKKKRVEISKCMYDLPPYPDHFDEQVTIYVWLIKEAMSFRSSFPQLHNKYLRARLMVHDKKMAEKFHRVVLERLEEIAAEQVQKLFMKSSPL